MTGGWLFACATRRSGAQKKVSECDDDANGETLFRDGRVFCPGATASRRLFLRPRVRCWKPDFASCGASWRLVGAGLKVRSIAWQCITDATLRSRLDLEPGRDGAYGQVPRHAFQRRIAMAGQLAHAAPESFAGCSSAWLELCAESGAHEPSPFGSSRSSKNLQNGLRNPRSIPIAEKILKPSRYCSLWLDIGERSTSACSSRRRGRRGSGSFNDLAMETRKQASKRKRACAKRTGAVFSLGVEAGRERLFDGNHSRTICRF